MKCATAVACSLLGVVLMAAPGLALDLTGTWDGKWSCTGFDGTKFSTRGETSILKITDLGGNAARASIDDFYFYNVGIIPDAKKPDESGGAALVECGTDDAPLAGSEAEIMRAKVKLKLGTDKGAFTGASIFEDELGSVGTCTYSYKRRDPIDPVVPACP